MSDLFNDTKLETLERDEPLGFEPVFRIEHDLVCTIEQLPKEWWRWLFFWGTEKRNYVIKDEDGKVLYKVVGESTFFSPDIIYFQDVYNDLGVHLCRLQKARPFGIYQVRRRGGQLAAAIWPQWGDWGLYISFTDARTMDDGKDRPVRSFTNEDYTEGVIKLHDRVVAAYVQESESRPKYRLRVTANMDFGMVLALILTKDYIPMWILRKAKYD